MCNAATENSIHAFERAGLGKAPFRIIGVGDKVGPIRFTGKDGIDYMVGAPGQAMGVCKFCGTGIRECWTIRSADGNVFDVGCDCVAKTGDRGMRKVIDAHKAKINREKRQAKGEVDRAYIASVLADDAARARLAALPAYPNRFGEVRGNRLEQVEWMARACGNAGYARLARSVRENLS